MITEKTVYVTESGMQFNKMEDASSYDADYTLLKYVQNWCLGAPLPLPGIGEGYCLETIQHTKDNIKQMITTIIYIVYLHNSRYGKKENKAEFDTDYKNLSDIFSELNTLTDEKEIRHAYSNLIHSLTRFLWYYQFDDDYYMEHYSQTLIYGITARLYNTSYITYIEYPADSSHNWAYEEDKWEEHVKYHKDYIANGGTYR